MKIPAVDVTLLVASATAALTAALRAVIPVEALARGPQPWLAAIVATAMVAPLAFVAFVLWKASFARATSWRRVAAKGCAIALGVLAMTSSLSTMAPLPSAIVLAPATAACVCLALLALAAAVYWTSPARRLPKPPKRS
ncbi:MAG: hypothetical protein U0269_00360 [Polyangiales bacterium]